MVGSQGLKIPLEFCQPVKGEDGLWENRGSGSLFELFQVTFPNSDPTSKAVSARWDNKRSKSLIGPVGVWGRGLLYLHLLQSIELRTIVET